MGIAIIMMHLIFYYTIFHLHSKKNIYVCVKIDRVLGVTNTEFFFLTYYNSEIKQRYVRAHLLNAL